MSLFTTYLPYFVLVLTLLVFVHEYGHYWVGRRFGIHAEVFSIGFGPELIDWTDRNGTRWKISAVPLGGYVKFLGDSDDPEVETRAVIVKYGLKAEFDDDTMAEANAVPDHVTGEMMGGRTDYRKVTTVTIDGEHARTHHAIPL